MSHVRVLLVAVLALALVSACGSKPKAEAPTAASTAAATVVVTQAAARPASTVSGGAGAGAVVGALAGFCTDWPLLAAQNSKLQAPSGGSMKEGFDATSAYMKALADKAPPAIKADFEIYAKFWSDYAAVMAKANYDMMKLATDPSLQKSLESMSDPKLDQAATNISKWFQSNCTGVR